MALQHLDGGRGHGLRGDGLRAVGAGAGHGGLEEGALKVHTVLLARLVHGGQDPLLLVVNKDKGRVVAEKEKVRRWPADKKSGCTIELWGFY